MADPTPSVPDFANSEEAAAYDAWFRAKVESALASTAPTVLHEQVMAEMQAVIDRHLHD